MSAGRPTAASLHAAMLRAEESLGLFELEARGRRYWPYVRNAVFNLALGAHGLMGKAQGSWKERPFGEFLEPLRHPLGPTLRRLRFGDLDPAELLVFNHNRQVRTASGFVCPYTFPFLEGSPHSRWVMQASHNGVLAMPPAEPRTKYLDLATAWSGARALAWPGPSHLRAHERASLGAAVEALSRELDAPLPVEAVLAEARTAILEDRVRRDFYPRLLDRVRPRAILLVVHYSRRCMPLTELARARGIPVVEVQHGLIGPTHLAYNYAPGRCPPMFPDYLFTFGNLWREITPGLPLPAERCPAVGFAWLEQHRREAERGAARASGAGRTLLFLSQPSIGRELSRLAVEVATRLAPSGWKVRYRLHPGEKHGFREKYPWLEGAPLALDAGEETVYRAFAASDAQLGVYSTAIYEGVAFGLRTLVADLPGWEGAAPLVDAGVATKVATAAEVVAALESSGSPATRAPEALWADRPRERFDAALAEILERGSCRPDHTSP